MELHPVTYPLILKGDFPLNHDCVLKVNFLPAHKLMGQYLTCRAQDSGTICQILNQLFCVESVDVYSVDDL